MAFFSQTDALPFPALRYEPDGYRVPSERIMGRHSAGQSFLRAFVQAAPMQSALTGVVGLAKTMDAFSQDIRAIHPSLPTRVLKLDQQSEIARVGAMHLADPSLSIHAYLRQSVGPAAYSLTGVTHTISSTGAMGLIADLLSAPVMPWDGLICTSKAVQASVKQLMQAQADYLRWRFGGACAMGGPQLATIPLGIDCGAFADFAQSAQAARAKLAIHEDDVVFLFLGRLSFHAKAHPLPMYLGLEEVAKKLKRNLVLIQCGWFANDYIENAFRDGAKRFAPSVRHIFLDGRKPEMRAAAWGACDVFMSLSDNVQETFGLTLIEAMAAGKPVIATDWDGYRQTARHGETGFMIPTSMPAQFHDDLALSHAAGTLNYDQYLAQASAYVSVDLRALREAIERLVEAPELRAQMGRAGQKLAREQFDWPVILRAYRQFWAELAARRAQATQGAAPRPGVQINPGLLFSTYPTWQIDETSRFMRISDAATWRERAAHPLFGAAGGDGVTMGAVLQCFDDAPLNAQDLLARLPDMKITQIIDALARLAKMGLVQRV